MATMTPMEPLTLETRAARRRRRDAIENGLATRSNAMTVERQAVEALCAIALDDGMSSREVAAIVGISHDTVVKWARKARDRSTEPTPEDG